MLSPLSCFASRTGGNERSEQGESEKELEHKALEQHAAEGSDHGRAGLKLYRFVCLPF